MANGRPTVALPYDQQFHNPEINIALGLDPDSKTRLFPAAEDAAQFGFDATPRTYGAYVNTDSQYDRFLTPEDMENLQFIRGERQSVGAKWRNATFKTLGTFGLAVADNFLGTAVGIMNAGSPVGEASDMLDAINRNPLSLRIADWRKDMETFAPNYRTRAETEMPFWEAMIPFSGGATNFWADEFMKNLGFNAASFVGMGVYSKAFKSIMGTTKAAREIINSRSLIGKTTTAGKIIKTEAEAMKALREGLLSPKELESIIDKAKMLRKQDGIANLAGATLGAAAEARIESLEAMHTFEAEMLEKLNTKWKDNYESIGQSVRSEIYMQQPYLSNTPEGEAVVEARLKELYNQEYAKIQNAVTGVGNVAFILNTAVVAGSTWLQFGRNLSGGFNTAKGLGYRYGIKQGADKATVDILSDASRATRVLKRSKQIAKALGNPLWEGIEEGLQKASGSGASYYYERHLDPEASEDAADIFNSVMYGLSEAFTTEEGLREVFIGMLSGGLGTPTFGMGKASYKLAGVIPMAGGVVGDMKAIKANYQNAQLVAKKLEDVVNSERFKKGYTSLTAMMHDLRQMQEAIENNDAFTYKNAEARLFLEDVLLFHQAGMFDDFIDKLDSINNSSAQQLREMTAFVAEDGTVDIAKGLHASKTDSEIKNFYREKVTTLKTKAVAIRDLKDAIDTRLGGMNFPPVIAEHLKNTLVFYLASIHDSEGRIQNLLGEINIPGSQPLPQSFTETSARDMSDGKFQDVEELNEYVKALREQVKDDEVLSKKVEDLVRLLEHRRAFVSAYIAAIRSSYGKIQKSIEELIDLENEQKAQQEAENFVNQLKDGTAIYEGETTEVSGYIFKVGDQYRVYKTVDESGKPIGEYEIVDPYSQEFRNRYTTKPEVISQDPFTREEEDEIIAVFRQFIKDKNFDKYVEEYNKLVESPRMTENLRKTLSNIYRKVTGNPVVSKTETIWRRKRDNKEFYVKQGPDGLYYLLAKRSVRYYKLKRTHPTYEQSADRGMTWEQLNERFSYDSSFRFKAWRDAAIKAIENLIVSKETLHKENQERYNNLRKELNEIIEDSKNLLAKIDKITPRTREKTRSDILELMNTLVEKRKQIETEIKESEALDKTLTNELEFLYSELDRAEENDTYNLKKRINDVKADITYNEQAISLWKTLRDQLKKLIDAFKRVVSAIKNLGYRDEIIQDKETRELRREREELEQEEKVVRFRALLQPGSLDPRASLEDNLNMVENQIVSFEEANDNLWEHLFVLEQIANIYKDFYTQTETGPYREETSHEPSKIQKEKFSKTTKENMGKEDDTEEDSLIVRTIKGIKNMFLGMKRSVENLFQGLAGSEYSDDKMNENPSQRRYYRFTRNTNLGNGQYYIKVIRAEDFFSKEELEYEKNKQAASGNKYDTARDEFLIAVFTDSEGNYIGENGKPLNKEQSDASFTGERATAFENELIYTSLSSFNLSTKQYGDKTYETDKTAIKKALDNYAILKTEMTRQLKSGMDVYVRVVGKSRGVPILRAEVYKEGFEESYRPVTEVIGKKEGLQVFVATKNILEIDGLIYPVEPGFTYVFDEESGNLYPVQRRKITDQEIDLIINALKVIAGNIQKLPGTGRAYTSGSGFVEIMKDGKRQRLKVNGKDYNLFEFISSLTFFTGDNIKYGDKGALQAEFWAEFDKIGKMKDKSPEEKNALYNALQNNKKYIINTNQNTRFHWDPTVSQANSPGGRLVIGMNEVDFLARDADNNFVFNKRVEELLRAHLLGEDSVTEGQALERKSIQIRVAPLSKDHEHVVVTKINVEESLIEVDNTYIKPGGYNEYLLSGNNLSSPIIQRGEQWEINNYNGSTVREEIPQFVNQYAIIDDRIQNDTKYVPRDPKGPTPPPAGVATDGPSIELQLQVGDPGVEKVVEEPTPTEKSGPKLGTGRFRPKTEEDQKIIDEINSGKRRFGRQGNRKNKEGPEGPATRMYQSGEVLGIEDMNEAQKEIVRLFGGQVGFTTSGTLINVGGEALAWGVFENAVITLYEKAEIGTVYHEAFHAMVRMFLPKEQIEAMYNEYRKRTNQLNLTDNQVEEKLAEDYRNYRLGIEIPYLKRNKGEKPGKIRAFFLKLKQLIDKLRGILTIEEQFERLTSGYYASMKVRDNVKSGSAPRILLPGVPIDLAVAIMDFADNQFFALVRQQPDGLLNMLSRTEGQVFIKDIYRRMFGHFENFIEQHNKSGRSDSSQVLIVRHILKNKENIIKTHMTYLSQLGVELSDSIEDVWTESVEEYNRYKDAANSWAKESLAVSPKRTSSRYIRLLIASLPSQRYQDNAEGIKTKVGNTNQFGLPVNVDFGKTFNTLVQKLTNLTSFEDMQAKLLELGKEDATMNTLAAMLGVGKNVTQLTTGEFMGRMMFVQTYAKSQNDFVFEMLNENGGYTFVNMNKQYGETKVKSRWATNYLGNVRDPKYKTFYKRVDGNYQYNPDAFKTFKFSSNIFRNFQQAIDFLDVLGIRYNNIERISNDRELMNEVIKHASIIHTYVVQGKQNVIFRKDIDTNVGERLSKLMAIELETTREPGETSFINIDGKLVYGSTLNSYLTLIVNEIKNSESYDQLIEKLPHLAYVEGSYLLSREGFDKLKKISVEIHDGSIVGENNESQSSNKQRPSDRLRTRIRKVIEGKYNLLRPSDNSIERFINLGVFYTSAEVLDNVHIDQFISYLMEEIEIRQSLYHHETPFFIRNTQKNYMNGIVMDMVKSVDSQAGNILIELIESGQSVTEAFERTAIKNLAREAIKTYIERQTSNNILLFKENGLIYDGPSGSYNEIFPDRGQIIDPLSLQQDTLFYTVNSIIGNIEQSKLLFNDPILFKNIGDMFKRLATIVGTKEISVTDSQSNAWISKHLDKGAKIKQQYDDVGNPIIITSVVSDVKLMSEVYNLKGEEPDGFGLIHLDEYRRIFVRNGKWTFGKNSLEESYQIEMSAETGNDSYIDPVSGKKLFKLNKNNPNLPTFNVLKPQHAGPLAEPGFVFATYKLALMPLIPSVINNRKLKQLNQQMESQNIGIVTFESSNKVGTMRSDGTTTELYNNEGLFNPSKENPLPTQNTYYKYWGIQVDTGSKIKPKVVTGTQMVKQILNFVMSMGKAVAMRFVNKDGSLTEKSEIETYKRVKDYLYYNSQRLEYGKKIFADKLGLQQDKAGQWFVKDKTTFTNMLVESAIKRELPQNLIDGLEFVSENGVDVLPNREKVENILFALADSNIIRQKRSGRGSVQVPVTMFEGIEVKRTKSKSGKEFLTSEELKFYEPVYNSVGEIIAVKAMEVYLPSYLEGIVSPEQISDERLLKLLGFRIPTQGPTSIERIIVKGFLPRSAGDTIVVPSDIVIKTGSDFDIDKLNIYIPNFYYNADNKPIYIDGTSSYEEYLKQQHTRFQKRFSKSVVDTAYFSISKAAAEEVRQLISLYSETEFIYQDDKLQAIVESLSEKIEMLQEIPSEGAQEFAQELENVLGLFATRLNETAESVNKLMSENEFNLKRAENLMIEKASEILESPDMARHAVMTPLSSSYLKDIAIYTEWLKTDKSIPFNTYKEQYIKAIDEKSFTSMVETEYLLDTERRFLTAQDAIGITAVNSTFHVLAQIADLHINPAKLDIRLRHNKTSLGISLGMRQDVEGKTFIAEMISQWVNAAVDAATDPFMFDLNVTLDTINVVLMLTMAGVPTETIGLFMKQPVITEYLKELNKSRNLNEKANRRNISNKTLIENVYSALNLNNANSPNHREITREMLEKGISNPNSTESRKLQVQVLEDFLSYKEATQNMFFATQAVNYDTGSFGKNTVELMNKLLNTETVLADDFFINFDKMLGVTTSLSDNGVLLIKPDNNSLSFVRDYYVQASNMLNMMGPFFKVLNNPTLRNATIEFMRNYKRADKFSSTDTLSKVFNKFKSDLIAYIILNNSLTKDGSKRKLSELNYDLLSGPNNMAVRFEKLLSKSKFENNPLLTSLDVAASQDMNAFNLILINRPGISYEADILSNAWKELINSNDKEAVSFGRDLIILSLLQNGVQYSKFGLIEIIPSDEYHAMVNESFDVFESRGSNLGNFLLEFYISNYNDNDIIPREATEGLPFYKELEVIDPKYNNTTVRRAAIAQRIPVYKTFPKIFTSDGAELVITNPPLKDYRNSVLMNSYGNMKIRTKDGVPVSIEPIRSNRDMSYVSEQTSSTSLLTEFSKLRTENGVSLESLGFTEEMWNSLTQSQQDNILKCGK